MARSQRELRFFFFFCWFESSVFAAFPFPFFPVVLLFFNVQGPSNMLYSGAPLCRRRLIGL